ncbi:MAG: hypothetical protein GC137_06765 [Alphaproteobacteria bacterium]|nr:hypothetical protein [Alphaproteobacteria bacterium]
MITVACFFSLPVMAEPYSVRIKTTDDHVFERECDTSYPCYVTVGDQNIIDAKLTYYGDDLYFAFMYDRQILEPFPKAFLDDAEEGIVDLYYQHPLAERDSVDGLRHNAVKRVAGEHVSTLYVSITK